MDVFEKIKFGELSETDLLIKVVEARREYTKAIETAMFGNQFGHDFDLEDEED